MKRLDDTTEFVVSGEITIPIQISMDADRWSLQRQASLVDADELFNDDGVFWATSEEYLQFLTANKNAIVQEAKESFTASPGDYISLDDIDEAKINLKSEIRIPEFKIIIR